MNDELKDRLEDLEATDDAEDDPAVRVVYHTNGRDTLETEDGEPVDPGDLADGVTVIALHRDYVDVDGAGV